MNSRKILLTAMVGALILPFFATFAESALGAPDAPESKISLIFEKDGTHKSLDGKKQILPENAKKIDAIKKECEYEIWHHNESNKNFWRWTEGTDEKTGEFLTGDIPKDNTKDYSDFDTLMFKSGARLQTKLALSDELREAIETGQNIYIVISAGKGLGTDEILDIDKLFYFDCKEEPEGGAKKNAKAFDIQVENDAMLISLPMRFNFKKHVKVDAYAHVVTISEASHSIFKKAFGPNSGLQDYYIRQDKQGAPLPEFGYGTLTGAIKDRSEDGTNLGYHRISYYSGGDEYAFEPGYIKPPDQHKRPWWLGHIRMYSNHHVYLSPEFDDDIVHTNHGDNAKYKGGQIAVGVRDAIYNLAAFGVVFHYPLEIEIYVEDNSDNLSAHIRDDVVSAPPGETVELNFIARSTSEDEVKTDYVLSIAGASYYFNNLTIPKGGEQEIKYTFTMPKNDVTVKLNVNPSGKKPDEVDLTDNSVELFIVAAQPVTITTETTMDYNVLTQDLSFYLGEATASLTLPEDKSAQWKEGLASGSFTVINMTPDIYHDFKVNGIAGNIVKLQVTGEEEIKINPLIHTRIDRGIDNFLDDPLDENYGENDIQEKIDPPVTGIIIAKGSVRRDYEYSEEVSTNKWEDFDGTRIANFCIITHNNTITVYVYNGQDPIVPPTELKEEIENNIRENPSKHLWWESEEIPLTVLRPMGDKLPDFEERDPPPVVGQYERIFTNQNEATIECSIATSSATDGKLLNMANAYLPDRKKALLRNYAISSADRAVFASDASYSSVNYPIRSGYFFNPAGVYTFTVTTDIYTNDPGKTKEHKQLVDAMTAAFRYESNMAYINPARKMVLIDGAPVPMIGSGTSYAPVRGYATVTKSKLFKIVPDDVEYSHEFEELLHDYTEPGTDPRLKRVLEGYEESGTRDSMDSYKYIEYVDDDNESIYKVTETTTIALVVNGDNIKVYTHPQMKNGAYFVRAYFADVKLGDLNSLGYSSFMSGETLSGYTKLDGINLTVVGSIFDDIR